MRAPTARRRSGLVHVIVALGLALGMLCSTLSAAAADPTQPDEAWSGTVFGVVTGSDGGPLADVSVEAFPWDESTDEWSDHSAGSGTTGTDGTFSITGLPSGRYTMQYMAAYASSYVDTWWGRQLSEDDADSFEILADDPPVDASMELVLGGTISGRVTSLDGTAIAGAEVYLYRDDEQGPTWFMADEHGEYAAVGLRPGSYVVNFTGPWRSPWLDIWWDGADRESKAAALDIEPGVVLSEINAALSAPSTISGRVTDPDGQPLAGIGVGAYVRQDDAPGGWNYAASRNTDSNGEFTIRGLRAGDYRLSLSPPWSGDPKYPSQWWRGTLDESAAELVDVPVEGAVRIGDMAMLKLIPVRSSMISGRQVPVGVPVVGESLVAIVLVDSGVTPLRGYQWFRDGAPISGATDSSYVADLADLGARLSVQAVLSGPGLLLKTVKLPETAPVEEGTLTRTGELRLEGTPSGVGSILSVAGAEWSPQPSDLHYQWRRAGQDIGGKTSSTYTTTSADLGRQLSVAITVTRPGFVPVQEVLAAGVPCYDDSVLPTPSVQGLLAVGSTLYIVADPTPPEMVLGYQWLADGVPLAGATASALKLGPSLMGKRVTATVTGALAGCATITHGVEGTPPRTALAATPTISGTARVRATLKVKRGTWTPGTTFSYRWYANGKAISKATKSSLRLRKSLRGKRITVSVTGRKSGYATVTRTSGTRKVR